MGEFGFVLGPLHMLSAEPVGLLLAGCEFLLHAQRHFDRERRHRLDEDFSDRGIERASMYRLAQTNLASVHWATAAPVARYFGLAMRVIAHRHAFPAGTADHEPLQQGRTLPGGTMVPLRTPGERVALHPLQVRQVVFPANVARMCIAQSDPILARDLPGGYLPFGKRRFLVRPKTKAPA